MLTGDTVCLSLLGTWDGQPWLPASSTLLQIFVSIQGMILCEKPWYNEPGREMSVSDSASNRYNSSLQKHTIQYAMVPWIADNSNLIPPSRDTVWKEVVLRFLQGNAEMVLGTVTKWRRKSITNDVSILEQLLKNGNYM